MPKITVSPSNSIVRGLIARARAEVQRSRSSRGEKVDGIEIAHEQPQTHRINAQQELDFEHKDQHVSIAARLGEHGWQYFLQIEDGELFVGATRYSDEHLALTAAASEAMSKIDKNRAPPPP